MIPSFTSNKKILFTILNWGLGHASRSLVLIQHFLKNNHTIYVASDGLALSWLQKELGDQVKYYTLPGYEVNYNSSNMNWNMIRQFPKIQKAISQEQEICISICKEIKPDLIISDNRYGTYHPSIKSILLTHQLSLSYTGTMMNWAFTLQLKRWSQGFEQYWVPDYPDRRLTGEMSNSKTSKSIHYIGPLSRFSKIKTGLNLDYNLAILSGPEPQRTKLEEIIIAHFSKLKRKSIIVRGTNHDQRENQHDTTFINLATSQELEKLIEGSSFILTRSGYSTLMDFEVLDVPVTMIPTPGQKEQEYIAKLHASNPKFKFIKQDQLNSAKDPSY